MLETPKPYKSGPDVIGIFATRSPIRPNPIALTAVQIINISTVGDNKQRLLECFDESLKRSDFVITTGGLGPTGDD
ncbi:TrmO family methyltransferase domain-containing protein, partial [Clostridioides difficile]|uniref:TrmO family methyltransferase domain-containing protein n=1 Tax=Clostridioides difficile TaxID=1496 RepID=UPI003AB2DF09